MKTILACISGFLLAAAVESSASDHADPMSLNAFQLQKDPVANITDLHAFVIDAERRPILEVARTKDAEALVISLSVRRGLLPWQIEGIGRDVSKYRFRVNLDLDPEVRFFESGKTRDGRDYQAALAAASKGIPAAIEERDAARRAFPGEPGQREREAQAKLGQMLAARGALVAQYQADESLQKLYGGILGNPSAIAEEATLDFELSFSADGENSEVSLAGCRLAGIPGAVNIVADARRSLDGMRDVSPARPWKPGAINVQTGVFDDPFIFPRFFRSNVVGIVTSIPLKALRRPTGLPANSGPILLWATTYRGDGRQSDHVGRSLRTQLPRFGYLNGLHPSRHVAEISRIHSMPTFMENMLATFLAPLVAHRHFDSVPDVMIYDLRKPAQFPNGRWLEDDVAKSLADAGETLLVELSHAESRQFPRAETNDKPFRKDFPYLAPRWTAAETAEHAAPGTTFGGFPVPNAPDGDAIRMPDFTPDVWRSLSAGLSIGVLLSGLLAWFAVRGGFRKLIVLAATIVGVMMLAPIKRPQLSPMISGAMQQPHRKLMRVLFGGGLIGLFGLTSLYAFGIRRGLRIGAAESIRPIGEQGEVLEDRQYDGTTFREVQTAVMQEPYYGSIWGEAGPRRLPIYETTFAMLAAGICSFSKRFIFKDAAARSVRSRADLRWGGPEQARCAQAASPEWRLPVRRMGNP